MAMTPEEHVRLLVGERVPDGGLAEDTFFSDEEIADLLAAANGDTNGAASLGWRAKAAEFAKYIDIDESGSTRKLSQMYRQAVLQADHFSRLAGTTADDRLQALRSGVVARTSAYLVPPDQGLLERVHNSHGERGNRA